MIERDGALSVVRQCAVLGVARSSVYYRPVEDSEEELELMTQIDRIFTAHPMYGSRRIQAVLGREGTQVGRRRVRRLICRINSTHTNARFLVWNRAFVFCLVSLTMTYFRTGNPYYHRRGSVSRSCSGWEGVVPNRFGRQTERGRWSKVLCV